MGILFSCYDTSSSTTHCTEDWSTTEETDEGADEQQSSSYQYISQPEGNDPIPLPPLRPPRRPRVFRDVTNLPRTDSSYENDTLAILHTKQKRNRSRNRSRGRQRGQSVPRVETSSTTSRNTQTRRSRRSRSAERDHSGTRVDNKYFRTLKIQEGNLKKLLPQSWSCHKQFPMQEITLQKLEKNDSEFQEISAMFTKSISPTSIEHIYRIENPYLWCMFLLKKNEIKKLHGKCNECRQFHGTKSRNVENIILNNFDWRKHGSSTGHKYGHGTSFSYEAYYASHYTDKRASGNAMFVVRLLFAQMCKGNQDMDIPPPGFDTTTNADGRVCVKYDDNTCYPEYLIFFSKPQKI